MPDIKLPEDSNKRLRKKDYDRPDVIAAKKAELEKFFKFNVIKSVPHAPRNTEDMRTTWVITEKSDNMLSAVLYGLHEGARNWYDPFHHHCISLGFNTAPGDPAVYSYDRDWIRGALAIHEDDAITCGNDEFYTTVLVPLLGQFSISKLE